MSRSSSCCRRRSRSERLDETVDEPSGLSAVRVLSRVELGNHEPGALGLGNEDSEGGKGGLRIQPVGMRHVGSGKVGDVDVEVNQNRARAVNELAPRLFRCRNGIDTNLLRRVPRDVRAFEKLELGGIDPAGFLVVAEQDHVLLGQQRFPRPDAGKLGNAPAEGV